MQSRSSAFPRSNAQTNAGPQGDSLSAATCGSPGVRWHTPLVTEQLVATEPGIGVPQGNTPDRDRTNTKPWVRVSRHRGRNHSHSHSHCNREPLLALPRVVQGRDRDLSRVQFPSRHRDHHDASHRPHHASHRRSNYHHRHASHRWHHHVHRHDGQRMTEQPKMPVTQPPPS
jgi:hypothetical protein